MKYRRPKSSLVKYLRHRLPFGYQSLAYIFNKVGFRRKFPGSIEYWERNYYEGGNSGSGSLGGLALFKSNFLNGFVKRNAIERVVDFGCGDGNQTELFDFPTYVGLDVSVSAIEKCINKFKEDHSKSFFLYDPFRFEDNLGLFGADLTISLDVIYHLVEDEVFNNYMKILFRASRKFVVVYSSNFEERQNYHERHRTFSDWVAKKAPNWVLIQKVENPFPYDEDERDKTSLSDFYVFQKTGIR